MCTYVDQYVHDAAQERPMKLQDSKAIGSRNMQAHMAGSNLLKHIYP